MFFLVCRDLFIAFSIFGFLFGGISPFYAVISLLFGPKPIRYAEMAKFCQKLPFTKIILNFAIHVKIAVQPIR